MAIHCHHSHDAADALCRTLNQKRANSARVFAADLTRKQDNQALITQTIDWTGRLDVLVNNASIFTQTRLEAPDDARWNALFAINVQAPFWLSVAARPHLAKQQGAIINLTDIHAETPLKGYAEYCQTKAALTMQTRALAHEFAPNIRVNAVAPALSPGLSRRIRSAKRNKRKSFPKHYSGATVRRYLSHKQCF